MSISTTDTRNEYVGNASTTTIYPITYRYFSTTHVKIYADDVDITSTSTFTGDGSLETPTGGYQTAIAYANTVAVVNVLDITMDQPTVMTEGGPFPAKTVEEQGYDRLNMQVRTIKRDADNALKLEDGTGTDSKKVKNTADTLLGFGSSGELKTRTADETVTFLNLPATVVDRPNKVWEDDGERAVAVPDYVGQDGFQKDTSIDYYSTGLTAGNWTEKPFRNKVWATGAARELVVAAYIGQDGFQTDTGEEYRSTGLNAGDWVLKNIIAPFQPTAATGAVTQQDSAVVTVREGGAKLYNAFPSGILIGSTVYSTVCPMTGHLDRDGDVWLYTSKNYGSGEWVGTEIYSATGTAGAIIIGDKEFRYAGLHHLGGDKLMIAMHTYTVSDDGDLEAVLGNEVEWAVSPDLGVTFGALNSLPFQGGGTYLAMAGNPYLFNGRVYLGCYDNPASYLLSQTLAEIEAGTNNNWRTEYTGASETENYLTTSYDGTTLISYTRVADILKRSTTDGSTWASNGLLGLPDWEPDQPTVEELEDGTLVHMGRQTSLGLEARMFYQRSGEAQWIISNALITSSREIPAWDGIEKHVYGSIIPLGGSMFGCLYALEADEEWNLVSQPTGLRSSVYFSLFASGAGVTPMNGFSPVAKEFDPRDIDGCNMMLVPESLVIDGTDITDWTDVSGAGHSITTTVGKEPQLASAASPNGKNAVQGALDDYFVLATAGGVWDIGSMYALFNYPNANFDGWNAIFTNNISADGVTDNLNFGAYQTDFVGAAQVDINGVAYSDSTFDPTDWAEYGARNLLSDPGTATEDIPPLDKGAITRLMTQAGFEATRNWLGKLVCLVTFDRRLTAAEHAQMNTWLGLQ